MAWQTSYPDSTEIYARASIDGGQSFGRIISLNDQAKDPISKSIAIGNSNPFFGAILTPIGLTLTVMGIATAAGIAFVKLRGAKGN